MAKSKKSKTSFKETVRQNAAQTSVESYSSDDFHPDYSDVIKDLKRIGTLAAFFLAVMIALSFFIG
jgi:hypothetical protein